MAPAVGHVKIQRDSDGGDNQKDGNGSDDDKDSGKDSSGSGSSSPKSPSFSPDSPFKVITREVTVTLISTAPVQTSTIFLSSSSSRNAGISTTTPSSTSISAATSSFSTSIPLSSSAYLNSPSNSSAHDGSPTASLKSVGMKTPLPLASIISIILGCFFFITLCLVIYVRNSRFSNRLANLFRRRRAPAAPTISSFEPKEFRNFPRDMNFRRSARSFVTLPDFYSVSGRTDTSRATSPSQRKGFLALNASSHDSSSSNSQDSYPQREHRVASSEIEFPEDPRSRTISVFDEYPFEHDAADIRPQSVNGGPTENRSSGFPQSIHDMTVEY